MSDWRWEKIFCGQHLYIKLSEESRVKVDFGPVEPFVTYGEWEERRQNENQSSV